jgi:hypothetical protein
MSYFGLGVLGLPVRGRTQTGALAVGYFGLGLGAHGIDERNVYVCEDIGV